MTDKPRRSAARIVLQLALFLAAVGVGVASLLLWLSGAWLCMVVPGLMGAGRFTPFTIEETALVIVMWSFVAGPPVALTVGTVGLLGSGVWQLFGGRGILPTLVSTAILASPWLYAALVLGTVIVGFHWVGIL